MSEEELKQDIKLQEEEEKPVMSDILMRQMLKDEIRSVLKDMLINKENLTDTTPKSTPNMESRVFVPVPTPQISPEEDQKDESPGTFSKPEETQSEWEEYQNTKGMSTYVDSEWMHKSQLLNTRFVDKETFQLHDLVLSELSLSNFPDTEIAFIFAVKMDCIEEFLSMGFSNLAKQELVHLLFRLRLMTSVEGLELIAQHGTSAISMSMDRLAPERKQLGDNEEEKKRSLGIGKVIGKIRGNK